MPGSQSDSMAESTGTDSLADGDNSSTISDSSTDTTATSLPPDNPRESEPPGGTGGTGMENNVELFGIQLEVSSVFACLLVMQVFPPPPACIVAVRVMVVWTLMAMFGDGGEDLQLCVGLD